MCETNNGNCAQICDTINDTVQCSCETGFILAADNLDCEGKNERTIIGNLTCNPIHGLFIPEKFLSFL